MSRKSRAGFVFYYDWEECVQDLTDSQLGALIRGILAYDTRGEEPELESGAVKMAFRFVKRSLDQNREKYEAVCRRNRSNAQQRWEGRDASDAAGTSGTCPDARNADTDTDTDTDTNTNTDTDTGTEPKREQQAAPSPSRPGIAPAEQEVVDFFAREGLKGDPGRFYRFYQGKNWRTKHGRPIFWQDRARDWDREERARQPSGLPRATQPAVDEGYLAEIAQFRRAQGESA